MVAQTCQHEGIVGQCDICKAEEILDKMVAKHAEAAYPTGRVFKWYLKVVDAIPSIVAVVILVFGLAILKHLDNKKQHALEKIAILHIETVRATDKNCNDCHLGASLVNLFNHPAVKGNDNTINLMMDKAKIKRW